MRTAWLRGVQLAEMAVPAVLFAEVLRRIDRLQPRPPLLLA
jgi:hypothetical protein